MALNPQAVRERWQRIRLNPECSLALTPDSVADYLRRPEHELVQERICETLTEFARYRVEKRSFVSTSPAGAGDLATCEGLEAFLLPAVEGVYAFGQFVLRLDGTRKIKDAFLAEMTSDISGLADRWEKGIFSGQPYSDEQEISNALPPVMADRLGQHVSNTESAAMACRVLIHVLTLKFNPPAEEQQEGAFRKLVADKLDEGRLFTALQTAINYLVRAFQKGGGDTDENKIASSTLDDEPGSGWSWTDHAPLPPLLLFTAVAVDAFAELDLRLIRPALDARARVLTADQRHLFGFYEDNRKSLELFQMCVDMARRWVQKLVLPNLISNLGLHAETHVSYLPADAERYRRYEEDLKREQIEAAPMLLYNSLYGLQILLWSWADWDDEGAAPNEEVKNRVNRALGQLVFNYNSIPVVRQVLNRFPYRFYLPGSGFFKPGAEKKCAYLDSGFLPLLTRLLVLFVVYGVGDRNLLEPVIRDLYVQLLQNRNRTNPQYSALWAEQYIEVFSTQRAVQALTYYHAYARGKEMLARSAPQGDTDLLVVRNKTKHRLVLELAAPDETACEDVQGEIAEDGRCRPDVPQIAERTFPEYAKTRGFALPTRFIPGADQQDFIQRATTLGNNILEGVTEGTMRSVDAARMLLNALVQVQIEAIQKTTWRDSDLDLLAQQYKDAVGLTSGETA